MNVVQINDSGIIAQRGDANRVAPARVRCVMCNARLDDWRSHVRCKDISNLKLRDISSMAVAISIGFGPDAFPFVTPIGVQRSRAWTILRELTQPDLASRDARY